MLLFYAMVDLDSVAVPGIPDRWCYMLNILLSPVLFGMPFLFYNNFTIAWQARAACFAGYVVLGLCPHMPYSLSFAQSSSC